MNWFQAAHEQIETYSHGNRRWPDEELNRRVIAAIDGFHSLFLQIARELKLRDKWPEAHCRLAPFFTGVIEHPKCAGEDIVLGVCLDGWVVESAIASPSEIRHMKDDYWQHILTLSTLGDAQLNVLSDVRLPKDFPDTRLLRQHKGSLVFSVAREYILDTLSERNDAWLNPFYGVISVTIPLESDEETAKEFFRKATEALYRSNQMLTRSHYQKRKRAVSEFESKRAIVDPTSEE